MLNIKKYIKYNIKYIAVLNILLVCMLDQFSKHIAVNNLDYNIGQNFFSIVINKLDLGANFFLTYNYGTAFSIIRAASDFTAVGLIICSIVISSLLLYWLYIEKVENKVSIFAISLIVGGALGNVYDRFLLGYVVDFIDVYAGKYHWPVFNLADSAISIGAIILCIVLLFNKNTPFDS